MKILFLPILAGFATAINITTADVSPIAKTTTGYIRGTQNTDGSVHIYKGVPFAAPPVGSLRWKAPQPHAGWKDTLNCTAFGASPYQNTPVPFSMWTEEFIAPPKPLSEDCLFLNVWAPKPKSNEKLPVLVWIYGGGFVSGSSACAVYDGENVAKSGVVYVSINYRVSIFGFMSHPELTNESSAKASGNYALLDQVAALQWIQKNISAFGGDPSKVTIAGQSAGSMSVQSLVASPLSKGLFRGAIAQSGGITSRKLNSLQTAEETGVAIATKAGMKSIEELRQLPSDKILELSKGLLYGTFAPTVDGYVLPQQPNEIFSSKKHNDVAIMAGWVTADNDFMNFAALPSYKWALSNKNKSFIYEYSHVPTDKPGFPNYGAFHTSEVPYALHTLHLWNRPWIQTDRDVEHYVSSYWINFVKTGDPNGTDLPKWPQYDKAKGVIMNLSDKPVAKEGLYKKEFESMASVKK